MKGQVKTYIALIFVVVAIFTGFYIGSVKTERKYSMRYNPDAPASLLFQYKLDTIGQLILNQYVDEIDNDSIMDRVFSSMLSSLDPHSTYISRKELNDEIATLRGNFEGVGIVVRMINDTVRAAQVISGGPSDKAGVQAGDCILSVDGIKLSGVKMSNDDVVAHLRGPRKSVADLKIKRAYETGPRLLKVIRDVIQTPSLSFSSMIDKETGYIHLTRFSESTYPEFRKAVIDLKAQGMKRMVLDLRGNGGGLLSTAIAICDDLLPGKELIVYTQGAHQKREEEHSKPGGLFSTGELIVMIDEYSASASEIVAGAIQDNDRGLIVGRRSFGKGLVQQQVALPDGSAMLLTVARYYTPSGRCIQRPYDKGTDKYYEEYIQQILNGYTNDSLLSKVTDPTPYHTSKGRVVYGGGGIYPDHTISYQKDTNIIYFNQLISSGAIDEYVVNLVSYTGHKIKKSYRTPEEFIRLFKVTDNDLEAVYRKASSKGVARNNKSIAAYKEQIRSRIKAEIGEMLYSNATFYEVLLWTDTDIKEAMSLFK